MKIQSPRKLLRLLQVIVLMATFLTFALSLQRVAITPLDVDELYQVKLIAQPLVSFLTHYWLSGHLTHIFLTKLFTAIQWDIFTLRFGSVAAAVISIPLMYNLTRCLFNDRTAMLSALLLSVTHTHIRYAVNIRGYSLMVMLTLLTLYCFSRAWRANQWRWWLGFSISLTLSLYNHVFAVFLAAVLIIFGVGSFWLERSNILGRVKAQLRYAVVAGGLLVLLLLPIPILVLTQSDDTDNLSSVLQNDWVTSFPTIDFSSPANFGWSVGAPYWQMSYEFSPPPERSWQTWLFVGFFITGVMIGLKSASFRRVTILFLLILLTPFLMTLARTLLGPWFYAYWRYFLFVMPPYLILASLGLLYWVDMVKRILAMVVKPAQIKWVYLGGLALLAGPLIAPIAGYTAAAAAPSDPYAIARYLRANFQPGDIILCVPDQDWRIPSGREACGVTLNLYPDLAPHVYLLDQLADYQFLPKFLNPELTCVNRDIHFPSFHFEMVCVSKSVVENPARNIWLVFWHTRKSAAAESARIGQWPVKAAFDSTKIVYLTDNVELPNKLIQAGQLALADSPTPLRKLENYISLANIYAATGNFGQAMATLDEAAFVSRWPEAVDRLAQLQAQISFLSVTWQPKHKTQVVWNDELALVGLDQDLSSIQPSPGLPLQINFYWQVLRPLAANYHIFLHLVDAQQTPIATFDYQPFDGHRPLTDWKPGQTVRETRTFIFPAILAAGDYTLVMGLYRPDTLERLPFTPHNEENSWVLVKWKF